MSIRRPHIPYSLADIYKHLLECAMSVFLVEHNILITNMQHWYNSGLDRHDNETFV